MVKLKGPALSETSSGAMAKALIYTTTKKGTSLKAWTKPSQPRTDKQNSIRAMMKFVSGWWRALTPTQRATWDALAHPERIAPYHAYVRENMRRWRSFRAPSNEYPAAEILPMTPPTPPRLTAGVDSAIVEVRHQTATNNSGGLIFRVPSTGHPATWDHLVAVTFENWPTQWVPWTDTPLAPGTYWYALHMFAVDGNLGARSGYRSVIVP